MHSLESLALFARVAELSSFTAAAASLGLPKASVSTGVKQLEARLGVRLLHRTTRRVELTQDGRAFYERCKPLLDDADELHAMFQQSAQALRGRLRVDMASGMARTLVIPRLPEFMAAHPGLEIELSSADRRVDLVRDGFDCVVRIGALGDSALHARTLGHFRIVNCASPAYLAAHGTPRTLQDLAHHRLVHYAPTLGQRPFGWEYPDGDGGYATLPMEGAITVNNVDTYQAACLAGLGLIQAPASGLAALLQSGALVEVLPELASEPMLVSLVFAERRQLPLRVRAFMEWIEGVLAPHLISLGGPVGGP